MIYNFILVFVMGVIVALLGVTRFAAGTIRIDQSHPERDLYRLEIDRLENLAKKKYILLKVDSHADLSQK